MPPAINCSAAIRAITRVTRPYSSSIPFSTRVQQRNLPLASIRHHSSEPVSNRPTSLHPDDSNTLSQQHKPQPPHAPRASTKPVFPTKPEYEMTFTCTPCSTRSTHRVSKQGYHYGSVLITCPECRNRHVISDHLGIFGETNMTVEDLVKEKGQLVKRGTLSEDGDLEFWVDGTTTKRGEGAGPVYNGEKGSGGEQSP